MNEEYKKAILNGDITLAESLAENAISENLELNPVIDQFSEAIREAGDLFEEGEFFLPELMRSAEAMKAAMTILEPKI
ncbi:MAG: B12-binding domain-containing protein [Candidatus Heimdallarchaeaceae archaeon]